MALQMSHTSRMMMEQPLSKRYDPQHHGARCDICPLRNGGELSEGEWAPVGPELHPGAEVIAIAESPGLEEVARGRPLVGRSGGEWNAALLAVAKTRPQIDLTLTILCKPPGQPSGAWSRMDKKLDQMNRKRSKEGLDPLPHPMTCCRPRLLAEVQNYKYVITLGKTATNAITGMSSSIHAVRGGPIWIDEDWRWTSEEGARMVMPTLHPSFIRRAPSWRGVLHSDLAKAFRWFTGCLRWEDPETLWRPTPAELIQWLSQPAPFWTYDVETDGKDAMTCGLRTIAIAIPDLDQVGKVARGDVYQVSRAVGISLLSADGRTRFYSPEDERRIKDILVAAMTDGRVWVGHNAGFFDRLVIEHHLGVTPAPLVDTLFPTRFRAPDLPKGLKVIGSVLTDVERWETTEKGVKIATGATDDDELLRYNIVDAVVNARIVVPLIDAATQAGAFRSLIPEFKPGDWPADTPWNLFEVDHKTQEMCVEMHRSGVWVDQKIRRELELEYVISVKRRKKNLDEMARSIGIKKLDVRSIDDSGFNPGSTDQIRDLFYNKWGLSIPPHMDSRDFFTESGLPGTGDVVLRGHLSNPNISPEQKIFIKELRLYRREKNKILGTVLLPMQRRDVDPKKGLVWYDGRVRSNWNAHTTSVGRLSSSGPNLQNIGNRKGQGRLKSIFAAPPGRAFIGADLDQAHLRIAASFWQIPRLLECFVEGKDPHNLLAYDIFGSKFKHADGWGPDGFSLMKKPQGGQAKAMRDVMKTFRYASIYWADPSTVWQVLTSTETDDGKLPYLDIEPREVRHFHQQWLEAEPEWAHAWTRMLEVYKRQGYMEEPVLGRRSGSLSDGKKNEVVNFPVLAAESSLMRLAEQKVISAFPFGFAGPGTGLIHQCHDSVCIEVPDEGEEQLEKWRGLVEECMTINVPGWEVTLTSEADVGRNLKEV